MPSQLRKPDTLVKPSLDGTGIAKPRTSTSTAWGGGRKIICGRRALLTIRMLSPVHQDVLDKLKDLLVARFRAALARSGRGGAIHARAGIEYIFTEPQAELQLESAPRPRRYSLPRRTRPGRDNREPEVAAPRGESSRAGAAETSPPPSPSSGHEGEGPIGHETVSSPDVGLFYTPAGGTENYFPGFVLEVGYSHPLEDAAAKRRPFP